LNSLKFNYFFSTFNDIEIVTKLFRREISVFQARRGRRVKRLEAQSNCGESLFTKPDEVAAEKMKLQQK